MQPDNMYSHNAANSAGRIQTIDQGLRSHMQRIYNRMTLGVLVTAIISYLVSTSPALLNLIFATPLKWVVFLAPLGIVMFGFNPARMSSNTLRLSFIALSALYGLSFASIFIVFTGESIARAFFIAAAMFAGLSVFGYVTKKNLDGLGTFAIMGIMGVFFASIISMILGMFGVSTPSGMTHILSGISIIAFSGLTAWETQRMKEMYHPSYGDESNSRIAWMGALNLYISFVALFQHILHFVGQRN